MSKNNLNYSIQPGTHYNNHIAYISEKGSESTDGFRVSMVDRKLMYTERATSKEAIEDLRRSILAKNEALAADLDKWNHIYKAICNIIETEGA